LLILCAAITLACSSQSAKESSASKEAPAASNDSLFVWDRPVLIPANLPIAKSATCRFKKGLSVSFQKAPTPQEKNPPERVYYSQSNEDEANTVSFVDLDTRTPKVQSNGGQATLRVINDSGESITLLNHRDGANAVELYTIFRSTGIASTVSSRTHLLSDPSAYWKWAIAISREVERKKPDDPARREVWLPVADGRLSIPARGLPEGDKIK